MQLYKYTIHFTCDMCDAAGCFSCLGGNWRTPWQPIIQDYKWATTTRKHILANSNCVLSEGFSVPCWLSPVTWLLSTGETLPPHVSVRVNARRQVDLQYALSHVHNSIIFFLICTFLCLILFFLIDFILLMSNCSMYFKYRRKSKPLGLSRYQ